MLRTRIAAVAAAALFFVATTAITAATAQTATSQPTGKPLQLLKIIEKPSKTTAKSHAKAVARYAVGRSSKVAARPKKHAHLAALRRHRPQLPVKTAAATPTPTPTPVPTPAPVPDGVWPTANPAMATEITASTPAAQPAPAAPDPSEVMVAGQTVKVASPDEVNEIDLGANRAAPQTSDAAPVSVAAGTPPHETSDATPQTDAVKAFAVAQTQQPNEVGSASWILQVLAALGGAVTAGTVAWFLIGGTPQRTYG
ncbi:MAG TPA: hypothetical protein VMV19_08015 [Xanthobacteraceae bacterium]|nr:hypothetical protein [Xanthobacteraceae bacterium]